MARTIGRPNEFLLALTLLLLAACVGGRLHDASGGGAWRAWWSDDGPVVPHATFPADCSLCHAPGDWHTMREDFAFDHGAETGVPLEGAHAAAACLRCHNDRGPVAEFTARGCAGCHGDPHEGTNGPDCARCHGQEDWDVPEAVAMHAATRFPLVGAHASAACRRCHESAEAGVFTTLDVACATCHLPDLERATTPDHTTNGWTDRCDRCHRPTGWSDARFEHTTFPLTGAHRRQDCAACHGGDVFAGTPRDCVSCHLADYQGADDPDHVANGFSTECQDCHTTDSWDDDDGFRHTGFPLVGAHASLDCLHCHGGGVFAGTPRECAGCHRDDFDAAVEPDHGAAGFSSACELCHDQVDWHNGVFDHVSWPLTGMHLVQGCNACHGDGTYSGTPQDCVACHQADYDSATDPPHASNGFPTDCTQCHDTFGWGDGAFGHESWALDGAHATASCTDCHVGGVFAGTPRDCVACHLDEYTSSSNPDHVAAGFPTTCATCHGTTEWVDGVFDHDEWELTGAHVALSCDACHVLGIYDGLPSDCVDCHLDDWQAALDPPHAAASFPHDCTICHGTDTWLGATFDHDFPIFAGDHAGLRCLECHVGGDFGSFSCIDCHAHRRSEMDDEHDDVGGYVYASAACYQCHPDGEEHAFQGPGTGGPPRTRVRKVRPPRERSILDRLRGGR